MWLAPIIHAIQAAEAVGRNVHYRLVHTGQHYDKNMSDTFFEELAIPAPNINLGCGGGTQAELTAHIMIAFEKELMAHPADLVMVVGDVTSTMACAIVAKKLHTQVAHVEAGIRSWDLTMPEEINRMVTDTLTDWFFTTSEVANQNLRNLGISEQKIHFVGNVMIDTLLANRSRLRKPTVFDAIGLQAGQYVVLTLHRPQNVDEAAHLRLLMEAIIQNVQDEPIIFPIHPRTAKLFYGLWGTATDSAEENRKALQARFPNLYILDPMGYLEFNYLVAHSRVVITDSGGITEETTVLGVPCITLRDTTERPETCTMGTNELIGTNPSAIPPTLEKLYSGQWKEGRIPALWDGHAAERIVDILCRQ